MNAGDFRELVVRPALQGSYLWSQVAENLLMGTAAQESRFQYLEQIRGPALGIFQMEPATHDDLWLNYIRFSSDRATKVRLWTVEQTLPFAGEMAWNLRYAAIMCRVHYLRHEKSTPLPDSSDPALLGKVWKQVYNTPRGVGTVDEFIANYLKYVEGKSNVD
jgi:hypothetical protein